MRKIIVALVITASACAARTGRTTLPADQCNELLAHYARGESFDKIAVDFRLADRDQARSAVHEAMLTVQKRYYHER